MSLQSAYARSTLSWSTSQTLDASTGNAYGTDLSALAQSLLGGIQLPIIFSVVGTVAFRLRRTSVSGKPTAKANVARGYYLASDTIYPITLESTNDDAYLSWIAAGTTAGTIYIGVVNKVISTSLDNPSITVDTIA